eukprot:CAMPEP_0178378416 /NCGR_PEP_ID=MMETSP0689_2-20121128/4417_1 /TAXON_ID=160604 /ORGANISM="Amphidinium massartii, Strain CS-259" /LENGTH=128 /DNA_ID=CAMNT_0019998489 /DNA_START=165 /DNA_END=551 /DNA_ORIENTATION=+
MCWDTDAKAVIHSILDLPALQTFGFVAHPHIHVATPLHTVPCRAAILISCPEVKKIYAIFLLLCAGHQSLLAGKLAPQLPPTAKLDLARAISRQLFDPSTCVVGRNGDCHRAPVPLLGTRRYAHCGAI